jgi:hypothetical protein
MLDDMPTLDTMTGHLDDAVRIMCHYQLPWNAITWTVSGFTAQEAESSGSQLPPLIPAHGGRRGTSLGYIRMAGVAKVSPFLVDELPRVDTFQSSAQITLSRKPDQL